MAFLSDETKKALEEAGKQLVQAIRDRLEAENINASGSLSDSIEYRVTDSGLEIWANDYFINAEVGTKDERTPIPEFSKILAEWGKRKGIVVGDKVALKFGYNTANKIKKYGSARYRGDKPYVDLISQPIEDTMPIIDELMGNAFVSTINDSLDI